MKTKPKNAIERNEALDLAPDYVNFIEGNFDLFNVVENKFQSLKKGQICLSYRDDCYVKCKVSLISRNDPRAMDGPLVRVSDGEYSWRVDGCRYAYPIEG